MSRDLIRYDLLVQDAMRGVMRKVLTDVAANGYLPGDHHFTISFRTDAPGVTISRRLQEQWPHELTIILQHQYSNLVVDDVGFGVTLSFRSIPEHLYVPYAAVTGFFDPSVEFGLRFESGDEIEAEFEEEEEDQDGQTRGGPQLVTDAPASAASKKAAPAKAEDAEKPEKQKKSKPVDAEGASKDDAKVVSIDAFRKKT